MAIMLPAELETAFGALGVPWPTEDEDGLHDCAAAYRMCAATLVGEVIPLAHGAIQHAATGNHGLGMDAATASWADYNQEDGDDGHLPSLAAVLNALANAHDVIADMVTALKKLLIVLAGYAAVVLAWAATAAVVTGGTAAIQGRLALTELRVGAGRAVTAFRRELERFFSKALVNGVETRLRRILGAVAPVTRRAKGPVIVDPSGYRNTSRERAFAGASRKQLRDMRRHRTPLGMEPKSWQTAVAELREALAAENILDGDVRLKGTSARFFSGDPAKTFPQTEDELRATVARTHGDLAPAERARRVEDAIAAYRQAGYGANGAKPAVAFFDSRHKLGLSQWPSDYDFQLSSDVLAERFKCFGEANPGVNVHTKGDWYNPYLLDRVAPKLNDWVKRWEEAAGRWVSIATYDRAYLERTAQPDDWVVL
ncbi:hypothetical protein OHA77_29230 [Streptosporangium sp. NBC_01639]|uniref:hypothetical protein n=1 Tax=Streptosporangium sp. NBC_01639 TaxID=2975948 RepID=UPI00386DD4EF|nr:hypothetical protein OHA77_29230 [Streptosporangium sp. NBC_01639]